MWLVFWLVAGGLVGRAVVKMIELQWELQRSIEIMNDQERRRLSGEL